LEVMLAVAAFAVLCVVALRVAPQLNADGYAYRASIVAMTDGHFLTLSTSQVRALAAQLDRCPPSAKACQFGGNIEFWVQLPGGRWISEKDPGYPFLAAPFQQLGIIRLAPLFYGMLGCLGLFFGARRWLLLRRCAAVRLAGLLADLHRRLADRSGHRRVAVGSAGR
jgi:hypothetical protein